MLIYLDNNATTPLLPEVVDAMLPYLREHFGNPSSDHPFGRRARQAVGEAREQVAELLGCAADEILFTSGATESNNLALRGIVEAGEKKGRVITSKIEHPATLAPCRHLQHQGVQVCLLDVDAQGRVSVEQLDEALGDDTLLVSVMHANNETGVLQPIGEIARLARERGALVHTDAAQSVGKVAVRVDALGVDLLSVAGHKLCAPKGVGALFVRRGTPLRPLVLGAGHERGLRPGTENVASIVGLGVACVAARQRLLEQSDRVQSLRDRLWSLLSSSVPGVALNGGLAERLPNTLSVRFPGVSGADVLRAAPELAASTGSACHDGTETPSSVLLAMGLSASQARETVRLSLGVMNTEGEVELAAAALVRGWASARAAS